VNRVDRPSQLLTLAAELRRETLTTLQTIEEASATASSAARRHATRHPLAAAGLGLTAGYALGSRTGRWLSASLLASAGRIALATALSTLARGLVDGSGRPDLDVAVPAGATHVGIDEKENET
jgi:uncharacterized membrane protein YfcA